MAENVFSGRKQPHAPYFTQSKTPRRSVQNVCGRIQLWEGVSVIVANSEQRTQRMIYVDREQMSGFRDPTASEHRAIARHVRNTYAKSLRPMVFWQYFFTTAAAMFILNLLVFSADKPFGANVIYAVFAIVSAAAACLTTASLKKGRIVLQKVRDGEYQVMECRAYEVSYNAEQVSTGAVKIVNERGQYCEADFCVDKGIARICEKDIDTKLLLMRCGEDFYDILLRKDTENRQADLEA